MGWCRYWMCLITTSICLWVPQETLGFSSETATEILNHIQSGDANSVLNAFSGLENVPASFLENRKFLDSLIEEMNAQYQLSLTISDACRLIRENLHFIQIPSELQEALLTVIQQIESGSSSEVQTFASDSCQHVEARIDVFGRGIYWPWEWKWFGFNKKSFKAKNYSHLAASSQDIEWELPPKMATGFVCALGGALLCIIPGGQAVGLTLIGTGLGLVLDGMASGERPYYVNSASGQRIELQ